MIAAASGTGSVEHFDDFVQRIFLAVHSSPRCFIFIFIFLLGGGGGGGSHNNKIKTSFTTQLILHRIVSKTHSGRGGLLMTDRN